MGDLDGGTLQTYRFTQTLCKPCLIVQLETASVGDVSEWLQHHKVMTLNVAGPREEKRSGIYLRTLAFLNDWLASLPRSSAV